MTTSQPPNLVTEDDMTKESKDFVTICNLCNYQGVWISPKTVPVLDAIQQHYKAQDTDILVASSPKTGTTWLKAVAFCVLNRFRYSNTKEDHPLLSNNPHNLVRILETDVYVENPRPDLTSFTSPRCFSTHIPFSLLPKTVQDSGAKVIYICRNPKDTFVSYWNFANKLKPYFYGDSNVSFEEAMDMFCNGVSLYGPFWDHVLGYWNESLRRPEHVLFLKYEDLKAQPRVVLPRIANFMGCPFSPQEETQGVIDDIIELCSFDKLSNLEVNKEGKYLPSRVNVPNHTFFRRGEIGDWKNCLTDVMVDKIDNITQLKFSGTRLQF